MDSVSMYVFFTSGRRNLNAIKVYCCRLPISVPAGIANSEEELLLQPKSFLTSKYQDIVTFDTLQKVGHFAAYQAPEKLHNSFR